METKLEELKLLTELSEAVVLARDPANLAGPVLDALCRTPGVSSAVLYGNDARLPSPLFFHMGLSDQDVPMVMEACSPANSGIEGSCRTRDPR